MGSDRTTPGGPLADGKVTINTDGSCLGNPGPGGWGAVLAWRGTTSELAGGAPDTTNNRMELTAAIMSLEALKRPSSVTLRTDSSYLRNGITEWIHNWKRNGWRTAARKPVKNADLWERLDRAIAPHDIHWEWVKGHTGDPGNEHADRLATEAAALQAENQAPSPGG